MQSTSKAVALVVLTAWLGADEVRSDQGTRPGAPDSFSITRELSAEQVSVVHAIDIGDAIGVQVDLLLGSSEEVDLDLRVFPNDPRLDTFTEPLCYSAGTTRRETCRAFSEGLPVLWAEVRFARDPSLLRGPTRKDLRRITAPYRLDRTLLRGPRLSGTELVADDALPLEPGIPEGVMFEYYEPSDTLTFQRLHRVDVPSGGSVLVGLKPQGKSARENIELLFFNLKGSIVRVPYEEGLARLDGDRFPGQQALVVTRLLDRGIIFREPSYEFQVLTGAQPIVIEATEERTLEGEGDKTYTLRVYDLAIAVFDGPGYELEVTRAGEPVPTLAPHESYRSRRVASILGRPLDEDLSIPIYGSLSKEADFQVEIRSRGGARPEDDPSATRAFYRQDTWRLRIRPNDGGAGFVVPHFLTLNERWPAEMPGTVTGNAGSGEAKVFRLSPTASERDRQYSAEVLGESSSRFDIAICDELGRAIDIADSWIRWEWREDQRDLFLVVFPGPGVKEGGPFKISLDMR